MPSSSAKQHRFMQAVAHNPSFAKKAGVPQKVGKDFSEADKGHKFKGGGSVEKESKAVAEAEMKALKRGHAPKAVMEHERKEHKEMGYKKGGSVETPTKGFAMKKGGHVKHHAKHMKRGGSAAPMARPARRPSPVPAAALAALAGPPGGGAGPMSAGPGGMPGMAHGGGVHHHHHYYGGGHVGPGTSTTPGTFASLPTAITLN